jgi:hypothetical protein
MQLRKPCKIIMKLITKLIASDQEDVSKIISDDVSTSVCQERTAF